MKLCLGWAALYLPAALFAQPQIGGGQCSSATLTGNYSLTLTGRQLTTLGTSGIGFHGVLQGVGTANFDGLSKVTFTWTGNGNSTSGVVEMWSGTYSLQANCIGTISISTGDMGTFTLASYGSGGSFSIDGFDGTYSFNGSGSTLPASCSASLLSGTYSFNGNGFVLSSGAIGTVNEISGLITFDGTSAVTTNWSVSIAGAAQNDQTSGTYTVNSNCTAAATLNDPSGNKFSIQMVITAAKGTNFLIDGASATTMFLGSGRTL